jgi:hypothetical protein
MCVFIRLLGLKYDQGPLAFVNELLLLGNIFKARLLRTLELRTIYRNTKVHTRNKYNKYETVHQSIK